MKIQLGKGPQIKLGAGSIKRGPSVPKGMNPNMVAKKKPMKKASRKK